MFGGQAGYTLIEMIMVIAILGLITVAITQTVAHSVRISSHGADSMTAIKQVEAAFHWISIDAQQAQKIEPGLNTGFPLNIYWKEWDGTQHFVKYSFNGTEMKRDVVIKVNDIMTSSTTTVVARYVSTNASATYCRVTGSGTFKLPDVNDAFTITGGQQASSGYIKVDGDTGGLTVTKTGTATYNPGTGAWSTPHAGDTVVVKATSASPTGTWTSDNTEALLGLTQDNDGDAILGGTSLILTMTAYGGDNSPYQETRQGMAFSRT